MKKHIPNTITCCNLISGCIAIVYAINGIPSLALIWIIAGAVFDFFDGMSARLLGVSSPIGKELDSLADVVTFGVAPSCILFDFLCSFHQHIILLPFAAFLIAAFSALRLAKFNLDERQTTSFIGLPTPANALFWGSLIVWMESTLKVDVHGLPNATLAVFIAMILLSCWLLVAELPLFALKFKHWGWKNNEVKYIFVLTSILLIACPLLMGFGIIGITLTITWYVLLSAIVALKRNA